MNDFQAPAWQQARSRMLAAWRQMSEREQLGLQAAAAALALLLLVLVLINPALRTLREAPQRLARLDQQLAQMQGWAAEAQRLQGQSGVSPAQAQAALQAATELLGADARLTLAGDRATLSFSNQSGARLAAWLTEARSAARARAVEAQLQRGPRGYGGSIVLSLGGGR